MLYEPAEDSFLIQKSVGALARGSVLEIGIGSGILSETALKSRKVNSVVGVDIKQEAIDHCKSSIKVLKNKTFKLLKSDLFSNVPKQKFDTIIFNPPYLPEQEGELWDLKTDISGGQHGYEIIERFLSGVNDYLDDNGFVLLLFSSVTGKTKVEDLISHHMLEFEQLNKLGISFEQLFVYKITKSYFRKQLEKRGVSNIRSLARGHRGLIYTGLLKKKKIAIKIQRSDIGVKDSVENEVVQLKLLNKRNIGPNVLFSGKNYFAYDYADGRFILDFFNDSKTKKSDVLSVLEDVFEQMFVLDQLGVNKEEMHHPVKHIVITTGKTKKRDKFIPVLLDFERCKKRDKTHNVTQFAQFTISGRLLPILENKNIHINMLEMLDSSQKYSKEHNRKNFERFLELLR